MGYCIHNATRKENSQEEKEKNSKGESGLGGGWGDDKNRGKCANPLIQLQMERNYCAVPLTVDTHSARMVMLNKNFLHSGSVAYFSFEKNELGTALSPLEQREKMRELYGDSIYQPPLSAILAETPDQLQLEKETKTTEEKAQGISSAPAPAASLSASTPAKTFGSESMDTTSQEPTFSSVPAGSSSSPIQQKETILQNGRRRITPQFLG